MLPNHTHFEPHNTCESRVVEMTVDEYETIRLIDLEEMTQEQCAEHMEIARTTVQSIYAAARKKLAECIVNGHSLKISGGEYRVCEHNGSACGIGCCNGKYSKVTKKEIDIN